MHGYLETGNLSHCFVGGTTALYGTKYNYLSHEQELKKEKELQMCRMQENIDKVNAKWDRISAVQDEVLSDCTYFGVTLLSQKTIENVSAAIIQWEDATANVQFVNVDALRASLIMAGLNSQVVTLIVDKEYKNG